MAHDLGISEKAGISKQSFPIGNPIGSRLPPLCIGNLLQVQEFLCDFQEVLGSEEPVSFEELERKLISEWPGSLDLPEEFGMESCYGLSRYGIGTDADQDAVSGHAFIPSKAVQRSLEPEDKLVSVGCMAHTLSRIHKSLLSLLITELQKIASLVDPAVNSGVSKQKQGRKKDTDQWVARMEVDMLPINELTWPEMLRRFSLAYSFVEGELDPAHISIRDSAKVIRCLQGDGGILCGSLTGVAGVEADALLLGRAVDQVFGSLKRERSILSVGIAETEGLNLSGNIPEWAKILDPVRELPTNVGARIRNRVSEALRKDPPEWAREILKHSISKEVYKGNASGPTKTAVVSVLDRLPDEFGSMSLKPDGERMRKRFALISDVIMRKCRIVLHRVAAADSNKVFCGLMARVLTNANNDDIGRVFGSPALSRPLDLRTIDMRLLHDAYGGSHEAFLEEVRELWTNLRTAHVNKPRLVKLAEEMSKEFESLYEGEVATLLRRLVEYNMKESISSEAQKEIEKLLYSCDSRETPWEKGICKVCFIDRNDDEVLLCDKCNDGYHTYCLNPPLRMVPAGSWYCPSCEPLTQLVENELKGVCRNFQDLSHFLDIASALEKTEYWQLSLEKTIFLLKFLCDESLNSALVRQHLARGVKFGKRSRAGIGSGSAPKVGHKFVEEPQTTGDQHKCSGPFSEKQLLKLSVRKEFLGSDSAGRLYWGFPDPDTPCGIIVNDEGDPVLDFCKWYSYQSDAQIDELVAYLIKHDPNKRELRESILHWRRSRLLGPQQTERHLLESQIPCSTSAESDRSATPSCLITKATALLQAKYAAVCSKKVIRKGVTKGPKWGRCNCLEPILPSRRHCPICHTTFFTNIEFVEHKSNNCGPNSLVEKGYKETGMSTTKSENTWKEYKDENNTQCTFDFDRICRTFLSDYPNKPCQPIFEQHIVPRASLRPLPEEACRILMQLKMNLLDMEAALPEGAKRSSKASSDQISAWCKFVKSSDTLYKMVQATVVLEDMIKTDYIKSTWWWRWSSVNAAAKIATLSALALRIYSLDAAIHYEKVPACSRRLISRKRKNTGKKGKEPSKTLKETEA